MCVAGSWLAGCGAYTPPATGANIRPGRPEHRGAAENLNRPSGFAGAYQAAGRLAEAEGLRNPH
jgi:hypothetical protein